MEWKTVNICDLCDSVTETYRGKDQFVVLINTSDVWDGHCLNHQLVPNKDLKGQFKKTFKQGDILYSEIRPANRRFAYVDFNSTGYIASTKLMVLRAKKGVSPDFLYQILRSDSILEQLQMLAESRSGTFPQITYGEMANVKVCLPSFNVQTKIASILSSLDAQIENNNRINANLEAQAQALFKSWFVDFEPWGGKMPDGWREGKLGEYCKFQRGVSYSSKDIEEGDYALLSMNNIRPYGGFIPDYSRKFSGKFKNIHLLQPQDLVIAITDITQERKIIGRAALMPDKPNLIYCTHLMRVESMMYSNLFLYGLFNYSGLGKYLAECSTGTTVLGLTADIITKIQWRFPNEEIASKYSDMVRPIFEEIFLHTEANARLAAIRDTLLPKLMKGEIEV